MLTRKGFYKRMSSFNIKQKNVQPQNVLYLNHIEFRILILMRESSDETLKRFIHILGFKIDL